MHMDPAWIATIVAVAGLLGTFAVWLSRLLWRTLTRTIHFLDDYFGQPGRPGVMARLDALEGVVQEIRAETKPNGGSSMRDVITRAADVVADIKDEQSRLRTQIELRTPPRTPGTPPKGTT